MAALKVVLLAAVLLGLLVLISCKDSDEDEKRTSSPNGTAQSANQKPGEKPEADEGEEGEEGPATPAAVAAEKAAPQQTAGKQFAYNFDNDTSGQMPAKFHSAKTGGGAQEKWVVTAGFCRSEEHTSELQSRENLVCRLLLEKKKYKTESR